MRSLSFEITAAFALLCLFFLYILQGSNIELGMIPEIILAIVVSGCLFRSYIIGGPYSVHFILLSLFCILFLGRYFAALIGEYQISNMDFFFSGYVQPYIINLQSLIYSAVFLVLTFVFTMSGRKDFLLQFIAKGKYTKYSVIFLSFVSLMYVLKNIYIVRALPDCDYLTCQSYINDSLADVPSVVRYISYFIDCSYILTYMLSRTKTNFFLCSSIYLCAEASGLLLGSRFAIASAVVLVMFLYGKSANFGISKSNFQLRKLIILFVFLIVLFQTVSYYRTGNGSKVTLDFIQAFSWDQGVTGMLVSLHLISAESISDPLSSHFLWYISRITTIGMESENIISYAERIGDYFDPSARLLGYGLGGNLISEFLLLGDFWIPAFFLYCLILNVIFKNATRPTSFFLSTLFFKFVIESIRGYVFFPIVYFINYLPIILFFIIVIKMLRIKVSRFNYAEI